MDEDEDGGISDADWADDDYDDDDCYFDDEDGEEDVSINKGYPVEGMELTDEVYKEMDRWNRKMVGIAYTILMRNEDESLTLHVRSAIPCYGELRKYRSTHGDEATQPEDRPGDLYWPFPTGTPVAIGVKFDQRKGRQHSLVQNDIARMISNDSPWRRGFGSQNDVIQTENGLIFKNTEIDPTVLVHMLKVIQGITHQQYDQFFGGARDIGFFEYLFIRSAFTPITLTRLSTFTNTYVWNIQFDAKGYLSGDSNDLTGGTLKNRFDYSRAHLQDVFKGKFNFMKRLGEIGKIQGIIIEFGSNEKMIEAIRTVWAECLASSDLEEVKVA